MPFYQINGTMVHMRGTKLPPPCSAKVVLKGSLDAALTCNWCRVPSGYLCDRPVDGGRTCDRALCEAHAFEVGKNRHYCPECRADHIDNPAQNGLFTSLVQP